MEERMKWGVRRRIESLQESEPGTRNKTSVKKKKIRHRYTCAPHPEPSSLLPPHTVPLGCPSAPAPSIQYRALNLDWQLVSYMILHTCGGFVLMFGKTNTVFQV